MLKGSYLSSLFLWIVRLNYFLLEALPAILEKYPDAKLIFILPPNLSELKNRLTERNTETPDAIKKRLSQVDREISCAKYFDTKIKILIILYHQVDW